MNKTHSFVKLLQQIRKHLPTVQAEYHVDTLHAFGSYVRGEQTDSSDFDLLVTFTQKPSLLQLITLENNLSDLLGIKVDLMMPHTLKEPLRDAILDSAIAI